ncbi:hypothetical protein CONPUDRAFT_156687 [Coniophora puteana RWD-64-598 SS2]|uniref:Uncharacterized protein n=1 Tax=Coniophora puteana (strain RWD-64-598) TaxID=741705 RepID=A0A5M3MIJ0_CONPW|nr:uncharacterized protein CONPUDRAFT_156687 [Coniophora puteana RWD-64-598 SS2]EIW78730.1 hypothetical protein CONPUDRAFT_156687 [Coniophora puteana RWD-64-598 SS2]
MFLLYVVLSLLKFIWPKFQMFIEGKQKIINLVKDITATLKSVSVDEHYTSVLYSTFIKALISAWTEGPTCKREDGTTCSKLTSYGWDDLQQKLTYFCY